MIISCLSEDVVGRVVGYGTRLDLASLDGEPHVAIVPKTTKRETVD